MPVALAPSGSWAVPMAWLTFFVAAGVLVVAAHHLARYGDVIAVRTQLGGVVVGTLFLAMATSLPELLTTVTSLRLGQPDLAVGNILGSNMANILMLAVVDLLMRNMPLLRGSTVVHGLTASLATALLAITTIAILANLQLTVGWVGVDSLMLLAVYFGGVWLIRRESGARRASSRESFVAGAGFPTLRRGVVGFLGASLVLIVVVPPMVGAGETIAEATGVGATFVGVALLAFVTSLPELLAALAAVRLAAPDLAVGNLLGSCLFNMLALAIADFLYFEGRLLGAVDPTLALVAVMGLLLINIALVGILARVERRFLFVELDALVIIGVYAATMLLLYLRGIGGA